RFSAAGFFGGEAVGISVRHRAGARRRTRGRRRPAHARRSRTARNTCGGTVPHADAPHVDERRGGHVRAFRAPWVALSARLPLLAGSVATPGLKTRHASYYVR